MLSSLFFVGGVPCTQLCSTVGATDNMKSIIGHRAEQKYTKTDLYAWGQVQVLADMETCGLGVDMRVCRKAQNLLHRKLQELEAQGEKLAGMKFSLSAPAEVAHVFYRHLKLPVPPGCKGKHHPSTDKQALEFLRYIVSVLNYLLTLKRPRVLVRM